MTKGDGNLMQIRHDVADPVQTGYRRTLMIIDLKIVLLGMRRAKRQRELRSHFGAHRRVDDIELHRSALIDGFELVTGSPQAQIGCFDEVNPRLGKPGLQIVPIQPGCEQCHVPRVAAQEQGLGRRLVQRPYDGDATSDGLVGVTDGAVSQEPVGHGPTPFLEGRMGVDDPAGEHDGGRIDRFPFQVARKPRSLRARAVTSARITGTSSSDSWADFRESNSGPDKPPVKPGRLWLRGIRAARLASASTRQTLRRRGAR